jgi:hypothetical protein
MNIIETLTSSWKGLEPLEHKELQVSENKLLEKILKHERVSSECHWYTISQAVV